MRSIVFALAFALGVIGCSLANAEDACAEGTCRQHRIRTRTVEVARAVVEPVRTVFHRVRCHRHHHRRCCR